MILFIGVFIITLIFVLLFVLCTIENHKLIKELTKNIKH
jgi:hypothetical protein